MKKYFYAVYSLDTANRVITFLNELRNKRFRFYYDDGLNKIKNDILDNIIKESSFVLVFINKNYMNNDNIIRNLDLIYKYKKDIILITLDDVSHNIKCKYEFKYLNLYDLYNDINELNILEDTFYYDSVSNDILYEVDVNDSKELYFKGLDLYNDMEYEESVKYLTLSSNLDNDVASNLLSWCYKTNRGVETDYDKAFSLLVKSMDLGCNAAKLEYAKSLTRWYNKNYNFPKALEYLTDLAMNGNLEAYYIIGKSYLKGEFTIKDYNLAYLWFKRGSFLGHSLCMYELSECYRHEIGVKQDYVKAIKWLKDAAHLGCGKACYELSNLYLYGYGLDIDKEMAFHYCLMAANIGYTIAKYQLGNYYYGLGVGVDKNEFLMRKWIWEAALDGDESARMVCDYPGGSTENILKRYEEYVFLKKSVED